MEYESCSSFISFAIEYGIASYVRSKVYQDPRIIRRKRGRPLLDYGVTPNPAISNIPHRPDLVNLLSEYGASPNEEFRGTTPWKSALYHLAMQNLHKIMETDEDTENVTTINLSDWVDIITLLVKNGAEPNIMISVKYSREIQPELSAINIIMHAFGRQFPIQATEIRRMLVSRRAKHHAAKRPVRRIKRRDYRAKLTPGTYKNLGGHSDNPWLDDKGAHDAEFRVGLNGNTEFPVCSTNLPSSSTCTSITNPELSGDPISSSPNAELQPLMPKSSFPRSLTVHI